MMFSQTVLNVRDSHECQRNLEETLDRSSTTASDTSRNPYPRRYGVMLISQGKARWTSRPSSWKSAPTCSRSWSNECGDQVLTRDEAFTRMNRRTSQRARQGLLESVLAHPSNHSWGGFPTPRALYYRRTASDYRRFSAETPQPRTQNGPSSSTSGRNTCRSRHSVPYPGIMADSLLRNISC